MTYSVSRQLIEAREVPATKDNCVEVAYEVKAKIVSILKTAVECGLISPNFPYEGSWISVTPSSLVSDDGFVHMKVMYDIRAFGFLVTKEHPITKSQIMFDYLMLFGNMGNEQKELIFAANSQQEYMRLIGED